MAKSGSHKTVYELFHVKHSELCHVEQFGKLPPTCLFHDAAMPPERAESDPHSLRNATGSSSFRSDHETPLKNRSRDHSTASEKTNPNRGMSRADAAVENPDLSSFPIAPEDLAAAESEDRFESWMARRG
jgi:hypothetical protein